MSFSTLCSIADAKPSLIDLQKMTYTDGDGTCVQLRVMEQIRPHFRQVAIALKFLEYDIANIEKKDDPVYDLLIKWSQGANQEEDTRPLTWTTLITAIRDAGVHEVANILTKYFVQSDVHGETMYQVHACTVFLKVCPHYETELMRVEGKLDLSGLNSVSPRPHSIQVYASSENLNSLGYFKTDKANDNTSACC